MENAKLKQKLASASSDRTPCTYAVCLFLAAIYSFTVCAAVKSNNRDNVLQLGARLNSLERELGQQNNKYLAALERIHTMQAELDKYEAQLGQTREQQVKREQELAQILRSYHLALVEGDAVPTPRYLELVKQNRTKAQAAIQETEALTKTIAEFQERLATLRRDEQELLKLTADLEGRKKNLTEVYLARLDEKQKVDAKSQAQRIQQQVKKLSQTVVPAAEISPSMRFESPLEQVNSATPSAKGVTFKFGQLQALKAPRAGRIVYNGELASYGKVLMIDHGDDIRTVMLGRFSSRLQKNAQVETGDTLGYTEEGGDSLYFEVRKKNVAQNTINWMAPTAMGKI